MNARAFREDWRRDKSRAFDLERNSTAGGVVEFDLWGVRRRVYANANFSIYSRQTCNAKMRSRICSSVAEPATTLIGSV